MALLGTTRLLIFTKNICPIRTEILRMYIQRNHIFDILKGILRYHWDLQFSSTFEYKKLWLHTYHDWF